MSAEMLVDQPSPAKTCGIQFTLYSMPPPHTVASVTERRPSDCGKNAPTRTLSPLVMLALAPIGSATAAPATSVNAASRKWLAFNTLMLAAPFLQSSGGTWQLLLHATRHEFAFGRSPN